jgi:hypothetical protein
MHIQLNLNDSAVCVVNQTSRKLEKAIAVIRLFDLHGKLLSEQKDPFSLEAQQMLLVGKMKLPKMANSVFFLRLQLLDEKGKELDENFYWLTSKAKSYEALNELAPVNLEVTAEKSDDGSYSTTIANPGNETAFFIRLKVVDEKGELVLPLFLDENFFTLLPGESRKVKADLKSAVQPSSGKLFLVSEGWNSGTTKTNL